MGRRAVVHEQGACHCCQILINDVVFNNQFRHNNYTLVVNDKVNRTESTVVMFFFYIDGGIHSETGDKLYNERRTFWCGHIYQRRK